MLMFGVTFPSFDPFQQFCQKVRKEAAERGLFNSFNDSFNDSFTPFLNSFDEGSRTRRGTPGGIPQGEVHQEGYPPYTLPGYTASCTASLYMPVPAVAPL